jgi:CBS domain-containing protein
MTTIGGVLRRKGSRVISVRAAQTVVAVGKILTEEGIGAVVVEDSWMRPEGMFSERDLVKAITMQGGAALNLSVSGFMSTPIKSCLPTDTVDAAMARMTTAHIRHLPVCYRGPLIGIVSIGDLVKYRLEEKALEAAVLLDLTRMRS